MIVAGFIACAMVLGGGGSPSPWAEFALQGLFVAALIAWIWWAPAKGTQIASVPRPLLVFGVSLLALPLLQLVPLPPSIWHSLPQRELELASLSLVDAQDSWRPMTISPSLTLAGFLALVPAVCTAFAVSALPAADRRLLMAVIAVMALAGAALGAMQMVGGEDAFRLYEQSHRGWLTAFHANRNAAADVLLIGSLALSGLFAGSPGIKGRWPIIAACQAILLVALALTGSRAGIALLVIALVIHWFMLRPPDIDRRTRWLFAGVAGVVLALFALPLALAGNTRLARVAERFDARSDARIPLWEDALDALAGYWPSGSGLGTFPTAFQPFESFEYLDAAFVNRAHNDYLELLLEYGLLAIPLLIGGALALFTMVRRAWRVSPQEHAAQLFGIATLTIIALHSIVDYPLRNMAIACLAGVAAGLLTVTPRQAGWSTAREGREQQG